MRARSRFVLGMHPNFFIAGGGFPSLLNLCIGHRTVTIETKSGVAVMAENPIASGVSKISEVSIMGISQGPSVFFPVSSDVIKRKEFDWLWPTGFPMVIARARKPPIGDQGRESNIPVVFHGHLQFFLSPFHVGRINIPILLHILSSRFLSLSWGSSFVGWVHPINHMASVATIFHRLSVTVKTFFACQTNKFSKFAFAAHGIQSIGHEGSCQ